MDQYTNKLFVIKTLKAVVLKQMLEVLKPYIKETNIMITKEFIKISTKDIGNNSITYIKLDAAKFESYYCKEPIIISIDTSILFKTIKSTNRRETITLSMDENNTDKLKVELTDLFQGKSKSVEIQLLALEEKMIDIKSMEFSSIISMPTAQFQQIIKDINLLDGKIVEIKSINKQLIFECTDGVADYCSSITEIENNKDHVEILKQNGEDIRNVKFTKSDNSIVQGRFKLSFLMNFIKASHLCDTMNILLANNQPLVLEYFVADLGILRLLLVSV